MNNLTKAEVTELIEQAVDRVVAKHYQLLGYDLTNSDDIKRLQANHIYLDKTRVGNEEVYKWVRRSAIGVAVTGFIGIICKGLLTLFN